MSADAKPSIEPIGLPLNVAALAVGLSVDTLQKANRQNELVFKYSGTKPLVDPDELKRWFKSLPEEKPTR